MWCSQRQPVEKGYAAVKANHLSDYQEMFDRLTLELGQTVSDKTTDQLLAAYKNGSASEAEKRQLEVMLFQYGRYLTISSSREDSQLPANLQGVWNYLNSPPWASDYYMNVNLQMNYWLTYSTNLAECALPLIDYIDSLREPGRVTAEVYFGVKSEAGEANGFSAHTQNTPFGSDGPVRDGHLTGDGLLQQFRGLSRTVGNTMNSQVMWNSWKNTSILC